MGRTGSTDMQLLHLQSNQYGFILITGVTNEIRIPEELTPEQIEAWRAFTDAHTLLMARLEESMREAGFDLLSYQFLLELERAAGRAILMHELADRLGISRSRVTRLTDRLAQDGLVERAPSEIDRRSIGIHITETGHRRFSELAPIHLQDVERLFARHLTKREAEVIARGLSKIAEIVA